MCQKRDDFRLEELRTLYDDMELAILFDWLELPRPEALPDQDLVADGIDLEDCEEGPVRLIRSADGYNDDNALSNAVARLVLSGIQRRLPQWALVGADGSVVLGRQPMPRRKSNIGLLPRFLCMINWADSGPGFSWPESYHATYLPGFDCYVVTASQDSPEMHGYTEEAIGHFRADCAVEEGSHRVIVDWWCWQARECSQHRWAYLFETGEIDDETASAWAAEVWDEDTDEPLGDLNQRST